MTYGPTHTLAIVGNSIEDISANGIVLDARADPSGGSVGDRIAQNTIRTVGRDYSEAVGIWASFPQELVIEHNELYDLPYTAISMGWRWDSSPTAARDNQIRANHIHHVMQKHDDGAAIYTLGRQPGSIIADNYIHDITRAPFAGDYPVKGIYLDEGSVEFTLASNLVDLPLEDALNLHKTGEPIYYDRPILLNASQAERQEIIRQAGPQGRD